MATLRISLKKVKIAERRLNLLNGSRLLLRVKKILPFVQSFCPVFLSRNPAVTSPKERLYDQMTSNPAFTERNIQKANAYLLYSRQEQKFGHVSHSTELVRMCLACQHFDFNSADWISDNLHVISS